MAEPASVISQKSSDTVTVGCKLPHGIHMDLQNKGESRKRVTLKGNNDKKVIGGFGITENVPKAHFDEWIKRNKNHPSVTGGYIFSMRDMASAEAAAEERKDLRNGLEALDQEKPAKDISPVT
jgi:hypothetical protein